MDSKADARIVMLEQTGSERTANDNRELQTLYLDRWLVKKHEQFLLRPYTPPVGEGETRSVEAEEGDTVKIEWACRDGTTYYQRVTIPAKHATLIVVPPKRTP